MLADHVPPVTKKGPSCGAGIALASLTPSDRKLFASWVDQMEHDREQGRKSEWTFDRLAQTLSGEVGYRVANGTLRRHLGSGLKARNCMCEDS